MPGGRARGTNRDAIRTIRRGPWRARLACDPAAWLNDSVHSTRSDCKGVRSGEQLQGQRAGVEWQRGAPPAKMLVDDVLRSVTMPPSESVKNCARGSGVSRQTRAPQGGCARCELRGAPRRRSGPRHRPVRARSCCGTRRLRNEESTGQKQERAAGQNCCGAQKK